MLFYFTRSLHFLQRGTKTCQKQELLLQPFSTWSTIRWPWLLMTIWMHLFIEATVLWIISDRKSSKTFLHLWENCAKFSFLIPCFFASNLIWFDARWKMFSIRLRSGDRGGILNKNTLTCSNASLAIWLFCHGSLSCIK